MTDQNAFYNLWDSYSEDWSRSYRSKVDAYQNASNPWALSLEEVIEWLKVDWIGNRINSSMSVEQINSALPIYVSSIQIKQCCPRPEMIDRCSREKHAAYFL